jgi:hypothetical protein
MAASTSHRLDCRAIGRRTLEQVGLRSYGYSWWLLSAEEGNFLALGKDVQYLYLNLAREMVTVALVGARTAYPSGVGSSCSRSWREPGSEVILQCPCRWSYPLRPRRCLHPAAVLVPCTCDRRQFFRP